MAYQGGPFLPADTQAVQQQYMGSSNYSYTEAMLWAQFSASDECSGTSTFHLPELSSSTSVPSSEHEEDLLATWLANYLARSDLNFASPAVADPGFINADLDPVPLPDWNSSAFDVKEISSSCQQQWVTLPVSGLPFEMQQQLYSPPATPSYRPPRESWQQQPAMWNSHARRELFRPHSAHHHVQAFHQGTPAHQARVTFPASAGPSSFARSSWSQHLPPVGNWTTSTHIFGFSNTEVRQPEMTLPQTRSPYVMSELLPIAAHSIPAPHLNSFESGPISTPSWYSKGRSPSTISPPVQMVSGPGESSQMVSGPGESSQVVSGPGESSTPSRKRKYAAMNDQSGVVAPGGTSATPVASTEEYVPGPALNTNGQPRASPGSAVDPQSVYARYRRDKITERIKTLQSLIPNGMTLDIASMLEEAHSYVTFMKEQYELLKSDENWRLATPNTYKGIDLTKPQVQVLTTPRRPSPKKEKGKEKVSRQ